MRFAALALASLAAGCVSIESAPEDEAPRCASFYAQLEAAVNAAGVRDAAAYPVDGQPALRVTRFWASFADAELSEAGRRQLWQALAKLGSDGWQVELQNLPRAARRQLPHNSQTLLSQCAAEAVVERMADPASPALRAQLRVPDAYKTWQQWLGLYPLTRWLVQRGIAAWHAETAQRYAEPLTERIGEQDLALYQPPRSVSVASLPARDNPLGLPLPTPEQAEALWARHAPTFAVITQGAADWPGQPIWSVDGPVVAARQPTVYRYLSHTRFGDALLLQLNYLIWFNERPKEGALDILGGRLDGLHWRVTLDVDGEPLMYDSIHPCGCYHLYFPSPRLRARADPPAREAAFVPQSGALPLAPTLLVAAKDHFLDRVLPGATLNTSYQYQYEYADYATLLSMPKATGGERRSLFADNARVPGTQRLERFLLWPMGIPSAGAMRQSGHHATAFVGRRHFDEARLFEADFERISP